MVALTMLALSACAGGGDEEPRLPLGHPELSGPGARRGAPAPDIAPEAQAALDSGNKLYAATAYAAALEQYRRAAEAAPQHEAPLFGIVMVATATRDSALADSAATVMRARKGGSGTDLLDVHKGVVPNPHPPVVPKVPPAKSGST
jgi:hypothetical protein